MIAKAPIAILSFNRPDYLDQTLQSLADQSGESLVGREIHLFQDGLRSEFSGRSYGSDETILANVASFRRHFPSGQVHIQETNLGIALHFNFIERYLFESRGFETAIFLEDDLVLSPPYLTVIDRLIAAAVRDERIGCVAAYGNRRATLAEQTKNPSKIVPMEHRWAFGLTRRQWLRERPLMEQYLAVIAKMDYAVRDHDKIVDWLVSIGYVPTITSQDGVKDLAMYASGAGKFMTYCCYGKYIGKTGVHGTEQHYESAGFANTQLCPTHAEHFDWPSPAEIFFYSERELARWAANVRRVGKSFPPYRQRHSRWKARIERAVQKFRHAGSKVTSIGKNRR